MKRILLVAALGGVLAAPAAGSKVTIFPGVGIGKVRLGMTFTQVQKALGPPQTVNARKQLSRNRGYIEYGWNFSTFWVGFVNTKGVLHAALIGTDLRRERTRSGIGVGSPVARVTAIPRVRCFLGTAWVNHPYFDPEPRQGSHCVLRAAEGRSTIFVLKCVGALDYGCRGYAVVKMIVRTSF